MATVLHKRTSTPLSSPAPGIMSLGELAMNIADGRLFMKLLSGIVVAFAREDQVYTKGEVDSLLTTGMSRTKRYYYGGGG